MRIPTPLGRGTGIGTCAPDKSKSATSGVGPASGEAAPSTPGGFVGLGWGVISRPYGKQEKWLKMKAFKKKRKKRGKTEGMKYRCIGG